MILWLEPETYVLQKRDDIPGIFNPGQLAFFGGAKEEGETWVGCAHRELKEELRLDLDESRLLEFTRVSLDYTPFGFGTVDRVTFSVRITDEEVSALDVQEGQAAMVLNGRDAILNHSISPMDELALWMHLNSLGQEITTGPLGGRR